MQKVLIALIGLVILGGGAWFFMQGTLSDEVAPATTTDDTSSVSTETATDVTTVEEAGELSGLGSFSALMGLGQRIKCEYRSVDEEGDMRGVFYTDGERFRVDAEYTADGETVDTDVINDGTYLYTWSAGSDGTMGVKMLVADMPEGEAADESYLSEESYTDMNDRIEYDCARWSVDASQFVPPSNVEFTDMQEMMNAMMEGMPEGFEMPAGY